MRIDDLPEGTLIADGFDEALLGYYDFSTLSQPYTIAVYSVQECVACLVAQGMEEQDAWDYFEFNVRGSYMGPGTPLFIETEA